MNSSSLNLLNVDATDNENDWPSDDPSLVDTVMDLWIIAVFLDGYSLLKAPYSTVLDYNKFFIFKSIIIFLLINYKTKMSLCSFAITQVWCPKKV